MHILQKKNNIDFEIESIKKETENLPHFITLRQAAGFLQVNYWTVYRLVQSGEIDAAKVRGVWRIPRTAIQEYLQHKHPFNQEDPF